MTEKSAQIQNTFTAGDSEGGNWTGVFVMPFEGSKVNMLGQLHTIISLSAPDEFDSKLAGDLLMENMQDVYYDVETDTKVLSRIKKATISTAKKLQHLLEREEVAGQEGIDLNILSFVIKDNFVYMGLLGDGGVMLLRQDNLIDLTEGLKDLTGRDLIKVGSGKFEKGDKFALLSSGAMFEVNEENIKRSLNQFSLDEFEEKKKNPLFSMVMVNTYPEKKREEAEGFTIKGEEGKIDEKKEIFTDEKQLDQVDDDLSVDYKYDKEKEEEKQVSRKDVEEDFDLQKKEVDNDELESQEEAQPPTTRSKSEKEQKGDNKFGEITDRVKEKITDRKTYQVILAKGKDAAIRLFELFKEHVWEGLLGFKGGGIYLRGSGPKKNLRGIIILIMVVAALLFLSIRGVKKHIQTSDKKQEVQAELEQLDEKFANGKGLGEAGDIAEATRIMEEALADLDQLKQHEVLLDEISAKEVEARAILDELQRVIKIDDNNLITDVAGFIEGAKADDITFYQGSLYITDSENAAIYKVDTLGGDVNTFLEQNQNLVSPKSLVFDGNGDLLMYDSTLGITKLLMDSKTIEKPAGLSTSSVGEVVEIENYIDPQLQNNYLYLLRSVERDVRKISTVASGYTWPDVKIPSNEQLAGAQDIEIDGKIYIQTNPGGILRYYVDSFEQYTLTGLDKPIDQASSIELDPLLVYFGDSVNKRVVVVTKGDTLTPQQGKYVAQIVYRGEGDYFKDIEEVLVDHDTRTMYILDGTKVFKVDLEKVDEYAQEVN